MAIVDTTNSYVTEAEATTYFDERLHTEVWDSSTATDKALLMARRLLDLHIRWSGSKTDPAQPMQWPRTGIAEIEKYEVPEAVKVAQMEFALALLTTDFMEIDEGGVSAASVGPVRVTLDPASKSSNVIPDKVFALVSHLGKRRGSVGVVNLAR